MFQYTANFALIKINLTHAKRGYNVHSWKILIRRLMHSVVAESITTTTKEETDARCGSKVFSSISMKLHSINSLQ